MKYTLKFLLVASLLLAPPAIALGATPATAPAEEHTDEVKLTEAAVKEHGIRVGPATMQALAPTLVAPARVSFNQDAMAHVGSIMKGRAVELKVRIGDIVKKDDELLVIESPELGQAQSEFIQKHAAIGIAESAVEPTKSAYERAKALYDQSQGIALGEVQKREADYRAAVGAFQTAKAAASAAENTLHLLGLTQEHVAALAKTGEVNPRFVIRAPLPGKVIEREVTLGELVSPEKEALLVLADTSTYWVLADVPESRLAEIEVGAKASVELSAIKGEALSGTVSQIAPSVDPETRSARVRIEVSNGPAALRPGMFARVWIATGVKDQPQVLVIPEAAVQNVEGGPSVFVPVEGEPNTFAKRSVQIGRAVGGMVPVLSGLKAGEELVIHGSFILKADLGKNEAAHEH